MPLSQYNNSRVYVQVLAASTILPYYLGVDKSIKEHEIYIQSCLANADTAEKVKILHIYHTKMTLNFQAERLIHLIITLFFTLYTLTFTITAVVAGKPVFLLISGLLLVLLLPYIFHYYKLENGVQRLYKLDKDMIDRQLSRE